MGTEVAEGEAEKAKELNDVTEALQHAVQSLELCKRRCGDSGLTQGLAKRRMIDEQAALLQRARDLMQEFECEPETACPSMETQTDEVEDASQKKKEETQAGTQTEAEAAGEFALAGGGAAGSSGSAAISQTSSLPQATLFRNDEGYKAWDEVIDGKSLVHQCCYATLKRTLMCACEVLLVCV